MLLEKRIIAFAKLGEILSGSPSHDSGLVSAIEQAHTHNGWFTEENILLSLTSLGEMLKEDKLRTWIKKYPEAGRERSKALNVGVTMAGNIPAVGFHDFLCVLISGNIFAGKLASEDALLLPAIADILLKLEPEFKSNISFTAATLKKADAFIATGSNNSARYFEYYFGKHPHIIRKNRNSVAIIHGPETGTELAGMGKDIFQYFGMGCRNVSKLYIPENYNLDTFFSAIVDFGDVINHNKYFNNHQYYRTIYLLNNEKFLDNNFLMLKETISDPQQEVKGIASPVATLYYERYRDPNDLLQKLLPVTDQIQCIASNQPLPSPLDKIQVKLGQTQTPELWDYADGIDTMRFLLDIK